MPTFRPSEMRKGADLELIRCTRQPGNLRITRRACALRYLRSREAAAAAPRSVFDMACRTGLEKCRSCPLGRLYAKSLGSH
jgi:hypothetical protein